MWSNELHTSSESRQMSQRGGAQKSLVLVSTENKYFWPLTETVGNFEPIHLIISSVKPSYRAENRKESVVNNSIWCIYDAVTGYEKEKHGRAAERLVGDSLL